MLSKPILLLRQDISVTAYRAFPTYLFKCHVVPTDLSRLP